MGEGSRAEGIVITFSKFIAMKSSFSLSVVIVWITTCCDSAMEVIVISNVACLLSKPSRRTSIVSKHCKWRNLSFKHNSIM